MKTGHLLLLPAPLKWNIKEHKIVQQEKQNLTDRYWVDLFNRSVHKDACIGHYKHSAYHL